LYTIYLETYDGQRFTMPHVATYAEVVAIVAFTLYAQIHDVKGLAAKQAGIPFDADAMDTLWRDVGQYICAHRAELDIQGVLAGADAPLPVQTTRRAATIPATPVAHTLEDWWAANAPTSATKHTVKRK